MPFLPLIVPLYPDVPQAPGVPPVALPPPGYGGAITPGPASLMTADAPGALALFGGPQWGVFDQNGSPVITADSVAELEYRKEFRISNFPVEDGGFASYNKVATPFEARIVMTCGGSDAARAAFLATLDAACLSLSLYTVVTPEITYQSVNVVHYDYRRTSTNGATLLTADVWLEEVRVTATTQFTQTAAPSGAAQVNGGTVQPTTPSSGLDASLETTQFT